MKKILISILCLLLFLPSVSSADIDLSGLSFAELIALKVRINLALWSADEWQAVTVPPGVYEIGKDIPPGHWTISAQKGRYVFVDWGSKLDVSKTEIDYMAEIWVYNIIYSTSYPYYSGETTQVDYELKSGQFIIINDGSAIFSPYTGKPDLGFK